jgi:hypothetical protein
MGDNELNGTPEGVTPDGASEQNAASQLQDQQNAGQYGQQTNQQHGQQTNQQYAGQYGQQTNQQYAGQYGQQTNQQYAGQYGQQANQQYAGQYGQQANQQYAGQYGQQANQQYAGQYGQQTNQQYAGQYGQQTNQQYAGQYGQQTNQQYADQYGQQMTQSTYDQTMNMYGDQAHKPETPKKRKGIKIAIISVVAALIIIAALVVVYLVFLKKTPKEVVEDAMENTAKELENGNISGIVGANDFDLDNIEFNSQVSLDNVSGAEALSGTQIECNGCTAFGDSNDFKISGSMTAAGEKATAEILSIGNKIYFSSPELLTKTLVLDANTIMSELGGTEAGAGGTVDAEALTKILDEKLIPAVDKFKDSIVYERVGKESFTDANGKTVNAEHYTITISTGSINDLSNAIVDCLNEYVDSNISDDMVAEMNISKDQIKQYIGTIPSLVGAVFTKDIVTDVYINSGKVVHIDSEYDIAAAGVTLGVTVDHMGDGDVTSDTKMVVKLEYGSQMNVTFDCAYKNKKSGDKTEVTADYTLSADANGESQAFTGNTAFSYDEKSGAIDGSSKVTANSEDIEMTYSGTLADVKKGKSFSLNDLKFNLSVSGQEFVALSGNMSVAESKSKISAPADSDVVDYSVLQGEEAQQYINTESAEKIISAWGSLFESADAGLPLGKKDDGDDDGSTDPTEEASTEAATEATTEAITEAATDDVDYSKEVLAIGDKTVKINDPKGYERSYGSSYSISLNDTKGGAYVIYSANEYADAKTYLKTLKETYKDMEDENTKIDSVTDSKVKAKDGTEVICLEAQMTVYDMKSTDITFIYPLGDGSIVCSISYWEEPDNIDIQKLCDTFIGAMEIK